MFTSGFSRQDLLFISIVIALILAVILIIIIIMVYCLCCSKNYLKKDGGVVLYSHIKSL